MTGDFEDETSLPMLSDACSFGQTVGNLIVCSAVGGGGAYVLRERC